MQAPVRDAMLIRVDDLTGPEIRALLEEHLRNMYELSPPESVHALDLAALRRPEITFWIRCELHSSPQAIRGGAASTRACAVADPMAGR